MSDNHKTFLQNEARLAEIAAQIKQEQPLTSSQKQPLSVLIPLYQDNHPAWTIQLQQLSHYDIRTVRGDGNCYYRAFLYSLVEQLIVGNNNRAEASRVRTHLQDSWRTILQLGYDEMALEAFYESILELFDKIVEEGTPHDTFHNLLNEENSTSDYATWYCRVMVSSVLKQDPQRFLPFLNGMDVATFCTKHVEPMGKECDNIQIICLAEAFGVAVHLEYLDTNHALQHNFGPEDAPIKLYFLYRPGHYDILYPVSKK